jgi:hypothetical protein
MRHVSGLTQLRITPHDQRKEIQSQHGQHETQQREVDQDGDAVQGGGDVGQGMPLNRSSTTTATASEQ